MRITLVIIALFNTILCADEQHQPIAAANHENPGPAPVLVRALTKLEDRMGVKFNIPFPADFDIDYWRKAPLAHIEISGRKLAFTRPKVNPFDEPRLIEWIIGNEKPAQFGNGSFDCAVSIDERGEFDRVNVIENWSADKTGNHLIERGEGETGTVFFERARLTFQARAKASEDSASALLHLEAFEKIAIQIQALAKTEILAASLKAPD
jgi:hypothetical protein